MKFIKRIVNWFRLPPEQREHLHRQNENKMTPKEFETKAELYLKIKKRMDKKRMDKK